jgi:hypothetical protein
MSLKKEPDIILSRPVSPAASPGFVLGVFI